MNVSSPVTRSVKPHTAPAAATQCAPRAQSRRSSVAAALLNSSRSCCTPSSNLASSAVPRDFSQHVMGSSHSNNVSVRAAASAGTAEMPTAVSTIGLVGLAVMGQNLALNIADKGFPISVFNRSHDKTEAAVKRAQKEGLGQKLTGYATMETFVQSLQKPRRVIILVKAGAPVDQTIEQLTKYMEEGDIIIDGGNEWYENTEKRQKEVAEKGLMYFGMGVSGGEEGARNGPSMMPGGSKAAYPFIKDIMEKVSAQVDDGPCVTYIGEGGSGNFVKMVHNGIEYGDMQLISEAYDVLKTLGGLTNDELAATFTEWNQGELKSFLVEITAIILAKKDDRVPGDYLVDKIQDKTGAKGTGKWTVQQAAELSVAAPTITASLDGRYLSALKDQRVAASKVFAALNMSTPGPVPGIDKKQLIADVRAALMASKVCSYAQGMNIIKAKSDEMKWGIELGALARIWKWLSTRSQDLALRSEQLLLQQSRPQYRRLPRPQESSTPNTRARLPANLVQAQRDFFGSHTYERNDGVDGWYHTVWDETFGSADSITTSSYNV
ncbi:MAG: hypothetical protein WDW38_009109 [Sanguina aurantia]